MVNKYSLKFRSNWSCILFSYNWLFFSKFEGKSRKKQILKVLYPVWFYSVLILLFCLFRDRAFLGSFFNVMRLFFPFTTNSYWFIGTYVGIVLISPFLLKMLNSLNNSQIKELLCLMFIFSSISPLLNFFSIIKLRFYFYNYISVILWIRCIKNEHRF